MYKTMIIDDDAVVRERLKDMIDWKGLSLELVCEAGDSDTALEMYLLYRPKIIISDISVNEETATRLDGYDVAMYDHHPITVRRPWMTIDISGGECGTSLLAKALLPDASAAITSFVDSIRQFDTWQFKKGTDSLSKPMKAMRSRCRNSSRRWTPRESPLSAGLYMRTSKLSGSSVWM